jgi:hypothetical protein
MGAAARDLAVRRHAVDRVADLYAAALETTAGAGTVQAAVLEDVARAAADVGIDANAPEAAAIARRLAEVELVE